MKNLSNPENYVIATIKVLETTAYEMLYERSGKRSRATGRDLWVFVRQGGEWIAAWRTMLDLTEQPA